MSEKLREALDAVDDFASGKIRTVSALRARIAALAAPREQDAGEVVGTLEAKDGRVLRLAGRYSGVRYGNAAVPCEFDASEIFEMLRAAPGSPTGETCERCGGDRVVPMSWGFYPRKPCPDCGGDR